MATTITGNTGITFRRGDTGEWNYQIEEIDEFGAPTGRYVDLTDITITMKAKWDQNTVWFDFPVVKTNPTLGMFKFRLDKTISENLLPVGTPPPDSSSYECQFLWTEDAGTPNERIEVVTVLTGTLTVLRDLVRSPI